MSSCILDIRLTGILLHGVLDVAYHSEIFTFIKVVDGDIHLLAIMLAGKSFLTTWPFTYIWSLFRVRSQMTCRLLELLKSNE